MPLARPSDKVALAVHLVAAPALVAATRLALAAVAWEYELGGKQLGLTIVLQQRRQLPI